MGLTDESLKSGTTGGLQARVSLWSTGFPLLWKLGVYPALSGSSCGSCDLARTGAGNDCRQGATFAGAEASNPRRVGASMARDMRGAARSEHGCTTVRNQAKVKNQVQVRNQVLQAQVLNAWGSWNASVTTTRIVAHFCRMYRIIETILSSRRPAKSQVLTCRCV